jgi:TIR domain
MPLLYPCFISYCHGEGKLMRRFIDDLTDALMAYLEPYFDERVYIDEKRLQAGYLYNEALATALCQSVCMVVVYVPKYERHNYCLREYAAMERIETQRKAMIGSRELREKGMIIPIVLRGSDAVPKKIRDRLQFLDFSKYTTASPTISRNKKYADQIDEVARYIYNMYKELKDQDVCSGCNDFVLPAETDLQPWQTSVVEPRYPR